MRAPESANLGRTQRGKLWSVALWSTKRFTTRRCLETDQAMLLRAKADPVGKPVDVTTATYTNEHGGAELMALWTDPDGTPAHNVVYYARVLEVSKPRWSTYDVVKMGLPTSSLVPATIQVRAWTSPVGLTAKN